MPVDSLHVPKAMVGDIHLAAVSCVDVLDEGELVDEVLSVDELVTAHLTIDLLSVSTAVLTINRELVPIGMAAQFRVDLTGASVAAGTYCLRVRVRTDSTPPQTRGFIVQMRVVDDEDCA